MDCRIVLVLLDSVDGCGEGSQGLASHLVCGTDVGR